MIGLGARDSLRLEAGLCLYGHDINDEVSPIEAMLAWTISKRRKEQGGFLGYDTVLKHINDGVSKKRCGFVVTQGKLPVREGVELFNDKGEKVGAVTSGGPAPSLDNKGIGMAYVDVPYQKFKTDLIAKQRGKDIPV
jgi:aminomethyltransferase